MQGQPLTTPKTIAIVGIGVVGLCAVQLAIGVWTNRQIKAKRSSTISPAAIAPQPSLGQKKWPQEPDGFMGLKFGSSEADALQLFPRLQCKSDRDMGARHCYMVYHLDEAQIEQLLWFVDGKLVNVTSKFKPECFETIKDVFVARFGQPHRSKAEELRTALNASYSNETVTWESELVFITVEKYHLRIPEGFFEVGLIAGRAAMIERLESNKAKLARKLARGL